MGTTRNLQEITIIGEEDGPVNGAPTRSPVVAVPRPTTIRVCTQASSDAVVATTEVTYRYEVELDPDSGEAKDATWSTDVPSWVDGATVDILAGHLCVKTNETTVDNNSSRLLSSLTPCVLSITSGSRDVLLNEACATSDTLCGLYSGNVRVTYTDLCQESQVVEAVSDFLSAGKSETDLLQTANEIAQLDDITLTSVTFSDFPVREDPTSPPEEPAITSELDDSTPNTALNQGLTKAGITMIAVLGVALIFLLALLYVRWKLLRNRRQGKKDEDAQSLKTAGSSPCMDRDGNRPDLCTPGQILNETKDGSNDSDTQKARVGDTARVLFGDGESTTHDGRLSEGPMNSVDGAMAGTSQVDVESVQMDPFNEILNDVTYVRKEEPENDAGSQQVDRPKLVSCLPELPTSVTL